MTQKDSTMVSLKGDRIERILSWMIEGGIYLLVIFLFTGKGNAFRSFGVYGTSIALLLLWIIKKKPMMDLKNPVFLILLALSASAVFSSLLGDKPKASFIFFRKTYLKDLLIFLVIASIFSSQEKLKRLIFLLALMPAIFVFLTFHDYFTKALLPNGIVDYDKLRGYNPSLAFYIPFIPCAIFLHKQRLLRITLLILLFSGVLAILLTGFRGGWVSLAVSLSAWVLFFMSYWDKRRIIASVTGLLVGILLFFAFVPAPHVIKRMQDLTTTGRVDHQWRPYLEIYLSSSLQEKLFGHGLDKETMIKHYASWYRQRFGKERQLYNPHNMYLYILFKQGAIGLLLYLTLIFLSAFLMVQQFRKEMDLEVRAMGFAMLLPFLGEYVVRGLVEDLRFMPLGFLLGLLGAYIEMERKASSRIILRSTEI